MPSKSVEITRQGKLKLMMFARAVEDRHCACSGVVCRCNAKQM